MATSEDLNAALAFARDLKPGQTQISLCDQMLEMAPLVEAMGYYDLADYLRRTGYNPVKVGGRTHPAGPGWRLINSDCIEVDGVRYAFIYSKDGFVSKEPIGGHRLYAQDRNPQELAEAIRIHVAHGTSDRTYSGTHASTRAST